MESLLPLPDHQTNSSGVVRAAFIPLNIVVGFLLSQSPCQSSTQRVCWSAPREEKAFFSLFAYCSYSCCFFFFPWRTRFCSPVAERDSCRTRDTARRKFFSHSGTLCKQCFPRWATAARWIEPAVPPGRTVLPCMPFCTFVFAQESLTLFTLVDPPTAHFPCCLFWYYAPEKARRLLWSPSQLEVHKYVALKNKPELLPLRLVCFPITRAAVFQARILSFRARILALF